MNPLDALHLQLRLEGKEVVRGNLLRQAETVPDEEMPLVVIVSLSSQELVVYYDEALPPEFRDGLGKQVRSVDFPKIDPIIIALHQRYLKLEIGHYKTYTFPELADAIARLKTDTRVCEVCFDLGERSPCAICADPRRDRSLICVVEEPADLASVEQSGRFHGLYHVLGGALSPIDGIGPDALRINELAARVAAGGVAEVILATNPNAEGDATTHYISDRLASVCGPSLKLSRIAYGMPLGGDLEYADHVTVGRSIDNRGPVR